MGRVFALFRSFVSSSVRPLLSGQCATQRCVRCSCATLRPKRFIKKCWKHAWSAISSKLNFAQIRHHVATSRNIFLELFFCVGDRDLYAFCHFLDRLCDSCLFSWLRVLPPCAPLELQVLFRRGVGDPEVFGRSRRVRSSVSNRTRTRQHSAPRRKASRIGDRVTIMALRR